ncbi:MAG: adenylyltransferase/cytidyltransferase family protein [bacterium]|nr:adenylyltransferase/cytidyltransferase family protein [bacterium]
MKIFYDIEALNKRLGLLDGKIVFTNGVFDLLHAGHIELLEFARKSGEYLVLGINDDASVKRLEKGENRPIYPLAERMEVLDAVMFVDFLIPFSQNTPLELIKSLHRVDVLVKGGDYKPHEVVGRKEVEGAGGKLLLFDFRTEASTSGLVRKVKS